MLCIYSSRHNCAEWAHYLYTYSALVLHDPLHYSIIHVTMTWSWCAREYVVCWWSKRMSLMWVDAHNQTRAYLIYTWGSAMWALGTQQTGNITRVKPFPQFSSALVLLHHTRIIFYKSSIAFFFSQNVCFFSLHNQSPSNSGQAWRRAVL